MRGAAPCFVLMGHQAPEHHGDISQQATALICIPVLTAWITSLELPAMDNTKNASPQPDQSKLFTLLLIIKIFRVFNMHYQTQSEELGDEELL